MYYDCKEVTSTIFGQEIQHAKCSKVTAMHTVYASHEGDRGLVWLVSIHSCTKVTEKMSM